MKVGPETRALAQMIIWAVCAIGAWVQKQVDATYNARVMAQPEIFTALGSVNSTPITPGSPQAVYTNGSNSPVMCYAQLETYGTGQTAYLILDTDQSRVTKAKAARVVDGLSPKAGILVPPSAVLYADCTDSSGGLQASFAVTVSAVALNGEVGALGGSY